MHSILYHIGRRDSPQYPNWETGVQNWLQFNTVDRNRFDFVDEPISDSGGGGINIDALSPANGSFAGGDSVSVRFKISSKRDVSHIELFLNGNLIDEVGKKSSGEFTYSSDVETSQLDLQNLITIHVTDDEGLRQEEEIIVYK